MSVALHHISKQIQTTNKQQQQNLNTKEKETKLSLMAYSGLTGYSRGQGSWISNKNREQLLEI